MAVCIHGNLCRAILNRTGYIYSKRCPNRCEFYEPKHHNEDKTCTMYMTGYSRYECSLCEMKASGVVVLPKDVSLFAVPRDVRVVW